jgi:hypothetical protein
MNAVLETVDALAPPAPHDAATHLQLSLLGVIAHLIEEIADGDLAAALATHDFLRDYCADIVNVLGEDRASAAQWREELRAWERDAPPSLPLLALREAGVSDLEIELLLATGLLDEDPRFGALFDHAATRQRRPTIALLQAWWRTDEAGEDRVADVRRALAKLLRLGLLGVIDETVPRTEWVLAVPGPVWSALRAEAPDLPWLRHVAHDALLPPERLIASPEAAAAFASLPGVLSFEPRQLVIVRGPKRNGRKTAVGSVARALGQGLLVATDEALKDDTHWRTFLLLALLLDAMPLLELESSPGANRVLPPAPIGRGALFVATGTSGAIGMADDRSLLTIPLPLPDSRQRAAHWRDALGRAPSDGLAQSIATMRLTSGNIRLAVRAATNLARLSGRDTIEPADLALACRSLQSDRLETLATRLDTRGGLADLAVDDTTREELEALIARCRHRETLADEVPAFARGGVGVRALFAGASGTGKTLATKLLAATLGKDLYRVDLAATVNKYIGETEKNLDRAFAAAEELDAILLLDEGDALMTTRTDVASANDRYANLETNFLLQRIESFAGIVFVTSNAAERIDKAFARRMDVVIHFKPPDEWARHEILRLHLPGANVSAPFLQDIACRCMLGGGQLRNVASHAALLALQRGTAIGDAELHAALAREYRKTGGRCPLPRPRD